MTKKQTRKPIPNNASQNLPEVQKQHTTKHRFSMNLNLALLLGAIAIIVYANTIQNGYVYDDFTVVTDNTIVTKGVTAIPEILSTPYRHGYSISSNELYRPLSLVMFAAEYQISGGGPMLFHFVNIILFAGCVVLLFLFLNQFFNNKKPRIAFLTALLFALHPIHTEVVANIKSRDELLCFFFAFLALNVFTSYVETGKMRQLLLGVFFFFLSLLSKETVITFVAVVPIIFFKYRNENSRRSVYITAGTVIAAVILLIVRFSILRSYNANDTFSVSSLDNILAGAPSKGIRFATEIRILGDYLKLLFVPYPLISDYSYSSIAFADFTNILVWVFMAAYVFLGFIGISGLVRKSKNPYVFGILFFLLTISLFSNIPFLIGASMAERFLFFPSVGFCLLAALFIEKWIIKVGSEDISYLKKPRALMLLVPLSAIYGGIAIARNTDWKSNYTLYRTDVENSPNSSRLNYNIGNTIAQDIAPIEQDPIKKKVLDQQSIDYLNKALQIYPDYFESQLVLGWVYGCKNIYDSAIRHYEKALVLNPSSATVNNNLGNEYYILGKYSEALGYFKKSLAIISSNSGKSSEGLESNLTSYNLRIPSQRVLFLNLARSYGQLKKYDSSIIYFDKINTNDSNYVEAQLGIANCFLMKQYYDSAETHYKNAIARNPTQIDAVNNLGVVYLNSKKYLLAIEEFKKVITIDPSYGMAFSNLGRAYFYTQQFAAAVDIFNKGIKLNPHDRSNFSFIAMSYKSMGKNDSARRYEQITN